MPYNQQAMHGAHVIRGRWLFTGQEFLLTAAVAYAFLVAAWYLLETQPGPSKSLRCCQVLGRLLRQPTYAIRHSLNSDERVAILTTLLKTFFAPLMTLSLMQFSMAALVHGEAMLLDVEQPIDWFRLFDQHGHWTLLKLLYFFDVLVFTIGYLVEIPRLRNCIKSVDSNWLGWAAAMVCYPPFNFLTNWLLGGQVSDFPQFDNRILHVLLNTSLLLCVLGYTLSSLALGFKASNLTHRGIVSRGVYSVVRHPAYTCKNMAWLIGSLPAIMVSFQQSIVSGMLAVAAVVGWGGIYVLRAITEEDHLRRVDDEYARYAQQVRYRFIPGIV